MVGNKAVCAFPDLDLEARAQETGGQSAEVIIIVISLELPKLHLNLKTAWHIILYILGSSVCHSSDQSHLLLKC